MFTTDELKYCIEGIQKCLEQLLFTVRTKQLAVFLANNDPNKAKLVGFKDTIKEAFASLDKFLEMKESKLKQEYMSNHVDLASVFLMCKREFHEFSSTSHKKVLIFLTNNDCLVKSSADRKGRLLMEAANFAPLNIKLVVTALNESFDYRIFYSELLEVAKSPLTADCCLDADGVYYKILNYITGRNYGGVKYQFYMHKDESDTFFNVRIQYPIKERKYLAHCMVTRNTNEEVKKVSENVQTGQKDTVQIGDDEKLELDEYELQKLLGSSVKVGFTLLCVSKDMLQEGMAVEIRVK